MINQLILKKLNQQSKLKQIQYFIKMVFNKMNQENHLKSEIINWTAVKKTLIEQISKFQNNFEISLSKQLVLNLFCLLVDHKIRKNEHNNKKMIQKQQQERNVIILTDSIFQKEQSNQPFISTIIDSIIYEELVNKSADNLIIKQQIPIIKRSNFYTFLTPQHSHQSAEEINNLLKDIN
ncbi:unnamed protein product [Paramecium primaurelia]|uniref:Uncharacterized protein n=1 Tax=Paramecium primaurelia TaxID=5886 RepID=A0A8S1NJJ7_PARPR|nr:unnamed protein product [Paramecium primaurelia]